MDNKYYNEKELSLKKAKMWATLILIPILFVYIASIYFGIPWLKAISEAALIGGLADWFAVVAIFRHPLGLKIMPHTNVIARNKASISTNISNFIKDKFLSKNNLEKFDIKDMDFKRIILSFLHSKSLFNLNKSIKYINTNAMPKFINHFKENNEDLNKIFKVQNMDFAIIIKNMLDIFSKSSIYDEFINYICSLFVFENKANGGGQLL